MMFELSRLEHQATTRKQDTISPYSSREEEARSYQEHTGDAWAQDADEGRDTLRKAPTRGVYP
jgi:hypothetical protein